MTTLGHILIILMYVFGTIGAMCGLMWVRWQRDKKRAPDWWRRQPP